MDFEQIKAWIEANKEGNEELKAYLRGFINKDSVTAFLESTDGKSMVDSITGKAITAYQEKGQVKAVEKAVREAEEKLRKELNPAETPEQKELREIKETLAKNQNEKARQELLNKGLVLADNKKIPKELVEFLVGNDEEALVKNIDVVAGVFDTHIAARVSEKLGEGYQPPSNSNPPKVNSYEDLMKNSDSMTAEQVAEAFGKLDQ